MHTPKFTSVAVAVAVALAALPAGASAKPKAAEDGAIVCNEAENSHRGGYSVSGGPVDPNPPAFLRGSQMRVGANAHAAERSPPCGCAVRPTPSTRATAAAAAGSSSPERRRGPVAGRALLRAAGGAERRRGDPAAQMRDERGAVPRPATAR